MKWPIILLLAMSIAISGCIFFGGEDDTGGAVLLNESTKESGPKATTPSQEGFNTTYGGVGQVTYEEEEPVNETIGEAVYGADNSEPEQGTATSETSGGTNPPPAGEEPAEEEVPEPEEDRWGTECQGDHQCSFKDMEACVYGRCEVQECVFTSDCPAVYEHCYDGKCYTEEGLYSEFGQCGVDVPCSGGCARCNDDKLDCIITGHSEGDDQVDYYICVECTSDYGCKSGYRCVKSKCVPGP